MVALFSALWKERELCQTDLRYHGLLAKASQQTEDCGSTDASNPVEELGPSGCANPTLLDLSSPGGLVHKMLREFGLMCYP